MPPRQITTAPPGTQAASLDIESAFRQIPILPDHKAYLVIQCKEGEFYIDHVCPFGIASGTGVQGEIMDAIVDILTAHGFGPSPKWVDDLAQFRYPTGTWLGQYTYAHDIDALFRITTPLGVPWKPGKCSDYAYMLTYVGFLWDLRERTVALPEDKRLKFLAELGSFLSAIERGPVSVRECMTILGKLSHITFVFQQGRAYLTNLSSFIASFTNNHATSDAPSSVIADMKWWKEVLRGPQVPRSLQARGKLLDLNIWVDASTGWGIGIMIGSQWSAWKLQPGWQGHGRQIAWAEMIAVELAIRHVEAAGYRNSDILIHSDNQSVIFAFNKGSSGNFRVNLAIRRATVICTSTNLRFVLQYVRSEDNKADLLSRGELRLHSSNSLPPLTNLPSELTRFLSRVYYSDAATPPYA